MYVCVSAYDAIMHALTISSSSRCLSFSACVIIQSHMDGTYVPPKFHLTSFNVFAEAIPTEAGEGVLLGEYVL